MFPTARLPAGHLKSSGALRSLSPPSVRTAIGEAHRVRGGRPAGRRRRSLFRAKPNDTVLWIESHRTVAPCLRYLPQARQR
jgi:hypothetical protein